ncbi:MAG: phosphate/phosphite/phosphonate ABC transporter substrate-binding protein [Egibacteraceae bacterium]
MMWPRGLLIVAVLLIVATASGTAVAQTEQPGREGWPDTLIFAAVPSEQSQSLESRFEATIAILESELGVDIEFFQAADYAGVIEAMIAERVDVAQFGPFSYVIAKANGADITPVAGALDGPGEEPGYQSYGITQGDNAEVDGLEDFAGRRVCFVDPGSTSGFLYPSAGLLQAGIDPETGIEPVFAGGHDASALSVANGDCEVGFAFDDMVDMRLIETGDLQEGDLKVVWRSEVIAGSPVAVRNSLPEDLRQAIATTVVEKANVDWAVENGFCESADSCSLSDEDNWGYAAVDDAFYDGVRMVCEVTKSAECEGVS